MSSGNYQEYWPQTWFERNRDKIISKYHNLPHVKDRQKIIASLKEEIKLLEQLEDEEWKTFRDKCIKKEKI